MQDIYEFIAKVGWERTEEIVESLRAVVGGDEEKRTFEQLGNDERLFLRCTKHHLYTICFDGCSWRYERELHHPCLFDFYQYGISHHFKLPTREEYKSYYDKLSGIMCCPKTCRGKIESGYRLIRSLVPGIYEICGKMFEVLWAEANKRIRAIPNYDGTSSYLCPDGFWLNKDRFEKHVGKKEEDITQCEVFRLCDTNHSEPYPKRGYCNYLYSERRKL